MSSPQIVYAHLKDVRDLKVSRLAKPTTIVDSSFSISKIIGVIDKTDSYDVFCMNGREVLTTNARELLTSKDVESMKVTPLLRPIQALKKDDTLEKASAIMAHYRMRAAPVVEDKEIVGAVYGKDVLELLHKQNLRWIPANNILTPNPITVTSNESLGTARRIMVTKRIDHLPVIKGGKISQVLTSMHLLQVMRPSERIGMGLRGLNMKGKFEAQIGNWGSTRVPNCNTNTPLSTVIESMLKTNTTCCLLTLWDNLHGIITYKDVLNILESKIPSDVPLYIVGLPEDFSSADLVKTKFEKIIRNLRKVYPEVEEAKISIKTIHNPVSKRAHYDVIVRVLTPYKTYNYTEMGWDLSKVLDILGSKVIRNLSQRSKKRWKTSIRKFNKKDIF